MRFLDRAGKPHKFHLFQDRKDEIKEGGFETVFTDLFVQNGIHSGDVQIGQAPDECGFVIFLDRGDSADFGFHFFRAHLRDVGDLDPVVVEIYHQHEYLEIAIQVVADIGVGSLGTQQAIAFLPHPQGMGFYAGQFGQVADAVYSHDYGKERLVYGVIFICACFHNTYKPNIVFPVLTNPDDWYAAIKYN